MKKIAILQSNYIPWKGYFDLINMVDLFIFHDDLQYTKNDWRNRNKIKTEKGLEWLTIPCGSSEKRLICEVCLDEIKWQKKHWEKLRVNYKSAKYFDLYREFFEDIYLYKTWNNLSELNQFLIKNISTEILGSNTAFEDSRNYDLKMKKGERVIELLKKAGAGSYLSGPSAKKYISNKVFENEGIDIQWMDYSGYLEYNQLHQPFEHGVTILDLIFNEGPNAINFMKSFSNAP